VPNISKNSILKIDDIKVKSKDEIGDLTLEFNTMKNNITKLQNTSKEFFDNATHELKTPLTVIKGYTQLLKEEEYNNSDVQIMLDQVENETTKMNSLVKKLLDLSKTFIFNRKGDSICEMIYNQMNELSLPRK